MKPAEAGCLHRARRPSAASPYRSARRTEITPVLPNHRVIAAFTTKLTRCRLGGGAADRGFEDAEHGVAVDHQLREVGDR